MKRLASICARGGSKGVKNKNLRPLAGKPLIAHTIERAVQSGLFATVAVSSDSEEILKTAGDWGAGHLIDRPPMMATDKAAKIPAIHHCAETVEERTGESYDTFVDLDATSPLRNVDDIRGAVALLEESGAEIVITGAPARRSPYFNLVEVDDKGAARLCKAPKNQIVRRQDSPNCYDMNGSIYVWTRQSMLFGDDNLFGDGTRLFVMPEVRSIDIDSELEFEIVEYLMKKWGTET